MEGNAVYISMLTSKASLLSHKAALLPKRIFHTNWHFCLGGQIGHQKFALLPGVPTNLVGVVEIESGSIAILPFVSLISSLGRKVKNRNIALYQSGSLSAMFYNLETTVLP